MDLLQILVGLVVALAAIIFFEWLVSPRLGIKRANPNIEIFDFPQNNPSERFLKLEVINKPLRFPGLPFLYRRIAMGCKAYVEIVDATTNQIITSPPMPKHVKWTSAPEGRYDIDPHTGRMTRFIDSSMIPHIETIDIGSSASETLDLFVKQQGDIDFYLHSGENLMHPTFQQQTNRLIGTEFYVAIKIIADNGSSRSSTYIVRNAGTNLRDLTIEDAINRRQIQGNATQRWWNKFSLVPFIIAIIVTLCLLIYGACLIPESAKYTIMIKLNYILTNTANIIAMIVAFLGVQNKWLNLLLIIAIQLFVIGIFFQLLSLI